MNLQNKSVTLHRAKKVFMRASRRRTVHCKLGEGHPLWYPFLVFHSRPFNCGQRWCNCFCRSSRSIAKRSSRRSIHSNSHCVLKNTAKNSTTISSTVKSTNSGMLMVISLFIASHIFVNPLSSGVSPPQHSITANRHARKRKTRTASRQPGLETPSIYR